MFEIASRTRDLGNSFIGLIKKEKPKPTLVEIGKDTLTTQHLACFAIGLGVATIGMLLYHVVAKKNHRPQQKHEIKHPLPAEGEDIPATLEELMLEKERLETLIAERELAEQEDGDGPKVQSTSDVGL